MVKTKKIEMTRKDAEKFKPRFAEYGASVPWIKGEHIGFNTGKYGWNWDLILYRGKYYVAGYRNFPKTFGEYRGE